MAKQSSHIEAFVQELAGFAKVAEDTLQKIDADKEANKGLFSVFSERMFTIRGTAQQLALDHIANIAKLGEEIALKGVTATTRPQIRKCIGALWDALTTVKFLLENHAQREAAQKIKKAPGDLDEQEILVRRLEATLKAFGGARPAFTPDEIEELLKKRSQKS